MISLANWDESLDLLNCPQAGMCAEIARNCTHAERDNRLTIHEVINCMDELESMIPKSFTTNQLVTATAFPGTELLDIYPLELRFLLEPGDHYMSCRLTVTNKTDGFVYCMVTSKHLDNCHDSALKCKNFLPPMSSSVATVCMKAEVEIPSNMEEWEIVMFTTRCDEEVLNEYMSTFSVEEDMPFEDVIKAFQELLGGELHRAVLTASVIVGSQHVLKVHTHRLGKKEETIAIDSMDVHPTEPWVLLITGDTVYIWNWQTNEKVGEYNSHAGLGQSNEEMRHDDDSVAKFIAREQWVVIGIRDGSITVHTCPSMDQVKKFKAHDDGVSALTVHPTRPFLLSCSYPFSLKLWDWSRDWSCTTTFVIRSPLRKVKFNPKDTTYFTTRGQDGFVQMWTIGRLKPIATTHGWHGRGSSYPFTYTGHRDFTAAIDNNQTISIWDLRKEKHVYTLRTGEHDYVLVVCHPTRPILVTASMSGCIQVWDSTTYRLMKAYDNVPEDPIHVGFTGSRRLVIGYREGISILDIDLE